jgi:hypothetical protein
MQRNLGRLTQKELPWIASSCLPRSAGFWPDSAVLAQTPARSTQTPKPSTEKATVWQPEEGKWMPLPDIFPKGGEMKVMRGNPATGAAEFYFKFPAGYGGAVAFPHPRGAALRRQGHDELSDARRAEGHGRRGAEGAYVYFPRVRPMRRVCAGNTDCFFFLASDTPFDIHARGRELERDKELASKEPKPQISDDPADAVTFSGRECQAYLRAP